METLRLRPSALAALAALIRTAQAFDRPADRLLSEWLRRHRVGSRDRWIVAEGFYAWLRYRLTIESVAAAGRSGSPAPEALALVALARQFGASLLPPPAEVDRYAKWLSELRERSPHPRRELPAWLWDRLGRVAGERRSALAEALLMPAPLDLRVNTLKAKRDTVLEQLRAEGLTEAVPTPLAPHGIRLPQPSARRIDWSRHPLFESGAIEVQDEGSQLLAEFTGARRGEVVVDFCAGAGGKTLALAARMASTGRIYALEVHPRRLANLFPRLARSGATNVQPMLIADENDPKLERLHGKADRVLVDAPCSGLGTLRRNPDLKWRQSPESVRELTSLQARILNAAARLVRVNGRLIYATCSLLREENEAVVEAFLEEHRDAWAVSHDWAPLHPSGTLDKGGQEESNATRPRATEEPPSRDRRMRSEHETKPSTRAAGVAAVVLSEEGYLRLAPDTHGCDGFFAVALTRKR
ncbi:MAG: RsmB/NOP family class I SAM-dependent RNA methyltransferase [Casimicrobiaceae bacterium]|nr:RsmB/NOP family class I SAM-dependent RNA methyltransferase [Casimicrobiaceae bacterium]